VRAERVRTAKLKRANGAKPHLLKNFILSVMRKTDRVAVCFNYLKDFNTVQHNSALTVSVGFSESAKFSIALRMSSSTLIVVNTTLSALNSSNDNFNIT
jgi:hypothetical protein